MASPTKTETVAPPLLDLEGAARCLGGVSRRSLQRLVAKGRLKPARLGLRRVLLRRADLDRLARG